MQAEPITDTRIPRPKRVAPTSRSCTFVVELVHYQHASRLALERSDNGPAITYADVFRTAIAEYLARNPIGSPASSSTRALEPTPIERRANATLERAKAELEESGFFVHARASLARDASICGLAGVPADALCLSPLDVTCRNCRGILERNAAALERRDASPATSPTTKKRSSSATKKASKKTGGRRR